MQILLLGGTGEVGHHIANGLAARGHEVTVLTRGHDQRQFPLDARLRMVTADKTDIDALAQATSMLVPEVVIDTVPSEASVENVRQLFADTIRQYIHCSSTGVYGPLRYLPGDEEHPWEPIEGDFYIRVIARDRRVMDLHVREGFPATILRPTMIIGPGALPVDNYGGRSPQFLRDLANHRPLELPEDGDMLIQGGYNADLAEAFILAAEQPDQSIGEIFNISCRKAVTLRQYLELFKEAMGSESPLVPTSIETIIERHRADGRVDDYWFRFLCRHMCFDMRKAEERLGYQPVHDLPSSVREVVAWAKTRGVY